MSPRTVDRDARRHQIVEAAVRVFARQGYAASRVEDVAREAGVAKGTVYLYARDRRELLVAAFEEFEARLEARLQALQAQPGPALERLAELVREALAAVAAEPELSRLLLEFWPARAFEAAAPGIDMAGAYAQARTLVAGLLDEAAREGTVRPDLPADTPTVVLGTIEGVVLQWLVDPGAVPLGRLADQVVSVLLHGLGPQAEGGRS